MFNLNICLKLYLANKTKPWRTGYAVSLRLALIHWIKRVHTTPTACCGNFECFF